MGSSSAATPDLPDHDSSNIRYTHMQNMVGNYAKSTYVRDLKQSLGSHAKNFKLFVKPQLEAKIDRNYKDNLNHYIQVKKVQTDDLYRYRQE